MTDSTDNLERRQFLKAAAALGATAASAGCNIKEDMPMVGESGSGQEGESSRNTPSGGGATPERNTPTDTPTSTPSEHDFPAIEDEIQRIENMGLGTNYNVLKDGSFNVERQLLAEKPVEDSEKWGLYATVEMSGAGNWDDLDGIYQSGEDGRTRLKDLLVEPAWEAFRTIDSYAGDHINNDKVNRDEITEIGIIFRDDEGETAGYVAGETELEEVYSTDDLEDSYRSHFMENFDLYPLEEENE